MRTRARCMNDRHAHSVLCLSLGVQDHADVEEVIRDDEECAVPTVAPAQHVPEPSAVVITTRALKPSAVVVIITQSARKAKARVHCHDFTTPGGCNNAGCEMAREARSVCRVFNSRKGCRRKDCPNIHEIRPGVSKQTSFVNTSSKKGAVGRGQHAISVMW